MKLTKSLHEGIREDMRQELIRLVRSNAPIHDVHRQQRRIARLDMAYTRGEEWEDFIPGELLSRD